MNSREGTSDIVHATPEEKTAMRTDIYNIIYTIDYFASDTYKLEVPFSIYDWVLADTIKKYWS